jgi:hypothetical protein
MSVEVPDFGLKNAQDRVPSLKPYLQSEVFSVSYVPINIDVSFSRIGIDEDNGSSTGLRYQSLDLRGGIVIKYTLISCTISNCLCLKSIVGSDEVWKVRGSGSPCHAKCTVVAPTIRTAIRSV